MKIDLRWICSVLCAVIFLFAVTVGAQNAIVPAKPEETARIKPLVQAEAKARETLNAKLVTLPEAQAVRDAQAALDKAKASLDKAAEKLPENVAWRAAWDAMWDDAYRSQAAHNLSSREYKPELNPTGELVFNKIPKP